MQAWVPADGGEAVWRPGRYRSIFSDLGCNQGAAKALGVEASSITASLYFETQDQANQARAAFEARGQQAVGVAHVAMYCLD